MRKLLVLLLLPILSMYFVRLEEFNELEQRVLELEQQTQEGTLFEQVEYEELIYTFTVTYIITNGDIYITSIEICELTDNECEIELYHELYGGTLEDLISDFYTDIENFMNIVKELY